MSSINENPKFTCILLNFIIFVKKIIILINYLIDIMKLPPIL